MARHNFRFAAFDGTPLNALATQPTGDVPAPPPGVGAVDYDLDRQGVDHGAMSPYWDKVDAILGGIDAMRATGKKYMPEFPGETTDDYNFRLSVAKMTNVFKDIIEDLSSRPFTEEIKVADSNDSQIKDFLTDVDGAGNDVTQFGAEVFYNGVGYSVDWIFVDYPKVALDPTGPTRTIEQDKAEGVRPNWSHVRATNVLEARVALINGKQELVYMRIMEPPADGAAGSAAHVRIMERAGDVAIWSLWQKTTADNTRPNDTKWIKVDEGVFSIGIIPLVPFETGRRNGKTFQYVPMMRDACDLQIQLYRDESGLNHAKIMTAFPMISANGVKPKTVGTGINEKPVVVATGPGKILYAPPDGKGVSGSFTLLEPASTSLTFLAADIASTIASLRELGRQPLTAQSGNLTVITAGVAAMKGNSAVKAWAIKLSLALENATKITALWLNISDADPELDVFKDFMTDDTKADVTSLLEMRQNADLSLDTLWLELRRRGVLSPDFSADDEKTALLDEIPDDPTIDPVTGLPVLGIPIKPPVNPATPLPFPMR